VAFHARPGGRVAGGPGASGDVSGVDEIARRIGQLERFTRIVEAAGVDAICRDVGDRLVVGALKQVQAVRADLAGQGDGDIAAVGQAPTVERDGIGAGIPQLDPLVTGGSERPGPGDFVDEDRAGSEGRPRGVGCGFK